MSFSGVGAWQSGRCCSFSAGLFTGLFVLLAGCGGGPQPSVQPPPPPAPDFSLNIAPSTVTVSQGATSNAVSVSVTPQNGFSGSIQVSLTNLPAGVSTIPPSPLTITPGSNASVLLSAASTAAVGTVTLTATATSGNLTHTSSFGLTVKQATTPSHPRSTYVRLDSVATFDSLPGESHHRHIAVDSARGHLFVANRAKNAVEVVAIPGGTIAGEIAAPGATSADISQDGTTVWVGSVAQSVYEIDAATMTLRAAHLLGGLAPIPGSVFDMPEEVLAMANGKLLVRMRQTARPQSLLALWDPATNNVLNLTSAAAQVFQAGLGVMAKSGDGTHAVIAANDSSGEIVVFDANGSPVAGPLTIGGGQILSIAANKSGNRFALVFAGSGSLQVRLFDGSLNPLGTYNTAGAISVTFSQGGTAIAVSEQFGPQFAVTLLDPNDMHLLRRNSDIAISGMPSYLEDSDATQLFFGIANRGVAFVDAATSTATLSSPSPAFSAVPVAQPATGPLIGNTPVVLTGNNFLPNPVVQFGSQVATIQSATATQMQVLSPASPQSGAVNITGFFSDGSTILAPDAFSYGPQIVKVLPNAGNKAGQETVSVFGYGLGNDPASLTVKIGGANATVQKIEFVSNLASSLGLDSAYPFPLQRATVITPAGTPGSADVTVASSSGAATLTRGFAYLQSEQTFAKPGFYKFVFYDRKRNRVYLSGIDHVDVFDLAANVYISPIQPPGGPPPNAGLRGLALMPDGSQLVVADFGAQSIYLINPDTAAGTATFVGGIPGYANSGPSLVAATSAKTIFVGMSAENTTQSGCSTCLAQMDTKVSPPTIAPATQPEISFLTGSPMLQADAAGNHVYFAFSSAPGGPIASWSSTNPGTFQTYTANASTIDVAAAADGNVFALRENGQILLSKQNLTIVGVSAAVELERIPSRTEVPGVVLHSSGALLYVPFLTGAPPLLPPATNVTGGVDILDARTGTLRRRIFLPEPLAMVAADINGQHGSFLTIDETGARIFALTTSGLTVLQLTSVPLGIGSLTPANGNANGGTTVTLRGSGFQNATKVTIGGKSVAVTFTDANTLTFTAPPLPVGPQQLVVSNPDGEAILSDAAFTAN